MTIQKLFIIIGIISLIISLVRFFRKNGNGILLNFCQYFLGLLFIFSGFVKAIDPLGTSYKMEEYFESFARDGFTGFWEKMAHFNLPISIIMIVAEIVLGFAIIVGWRPRWAAIGLLAINLFFLYLTGYTYLSGYCLTKSAIFMPAMILALLFLAAFILNNKKRFQGLTLMTAILVLYFTYCKMSGACTLCEFTETKMKVTDCGCFGDFMKLKPWETFYKDIFLSVMSLITVAYSHKITGYFSNKISQLVVGLAFLFSIIFCLYNTYWNEPMVDFRPYAIGSNINEKMKEIKPRKVEYDFIYKNNTNGEEQHFAMDKIPTDTIWTYVDRKDKVIDEGIPAPIHNLRFEDMSGNDVTMSLLNEPSESYWIVCYDVNKTDMDAVKETILPFAKDMRQKGVNVYCMTGVSNPEFEKMLGEYMDLVRADATPLKTMVRSNPGILKIKNGVVIDKWHYKNFNIK